MSASKRRGFLQAFLEWMDRQMKVEIKDSYPLFILILSLSLAMFNPTIRENDILRVGWAITHTIIAVGYVVGLVILKAIHDLGEKIK